MTPPLKSPVEAIGPVEVKLWVSSTALDTDFTAKLVDVHPDGLAVNLTYGIMRARYRHGYDNPTLLSRAHRASSPSGSIQRPSDSGKGTGSGWTYPARIFRTSTVTTTPGPTSGPMASCERHTRPCSTTESAPQGWCCR